MPSHRPWTMIRYFHSAVRNPSRLIPPVLERRFCRSWRRSRGTRSPPPSRSASSNRSVFVTLNPSNTDLNPIGNPWDVGLLRESLCVCVCVCVCERERGMAKVLGTRCPPPSRSVSSNSPPREEAIPEKGLTVLYVPCSGLDCLMCAMFWP